MAHLQTRDYESPFSKKDIYWKKKKKTSEMFVCHREYLWLFNKTFGLRLGILLSICKYEAP